MSFYREKSFFGAYSIDFREVEVAANKTPSKAGQETVSQDETFEKSTPVAVEVDDRFLINVVSNSACLPNEKKDAAGRCMKKQS